MAATAYAMPPSRTSGSFRRTSRRLLCPVCRKDHGCRIFADGGVQCLRIESDTVTGLGWMHWPNGRPDNWQERIAALPKPAPRPPIDADLAHRAYRALLDRCTLTDADRSALQKRTLTAEQITRHGYASGPADASARRALAAAVAGDVGQELVGTVPGFVRDTQGRLDLVCGDNELLIPVRDVQGRIVGIRRRRDAAEGKYRWLSGGESEKGGIGIDGATVHVAYPTRPTSAERVVIVEGEFKANIAADRLGLIVLSVAGVSCIGQIPSVLAALGDVGKVLIAYDADAAHNLQVAAAETRLARLLADAGHCVQQLTWPEAAGKGLDDILTPTPPTIPMAEPHPALIAATPGRQDDATLPAPVADADASRWHALTQAAHRSPNLGTERHTLTDFATMLKAQPERAWVAVPYSKIGDQAGIDDRTAERHLGKVGIRPKDRDPGILAGLIEVEVREVPERVNPDTGQVTGGYDAVHVRRLAPATELLQRIATAPASANGKRNNHGGKRECPTCGSTSITRTVTDRCAGCGELVKQTTKTLARDQGDTPPRQDDAHPPDEHGPAEISASTVTVRRGDKLTPTPEQPRTLAERDRQATREDRLRRAYASLTVIQAKPAPAPDADDQTPPEDAAGDRTPLTLFPALDVGCEGCGGAVAPGCRHCRACDPRTA